MCYWMHTENNMKHKSTQYFVNLSQFIYFLIKQKCIKKRLEEKCKEKLKDK